jgi:hypothetical protein
MERNGHAPSPLALAVDFFDILFGNGSGQWVYLWELAAWDGQRHDDKGKPVRDKVTHWFKIGELKAMAKHAITLTKSDVYFGCSLTGNKGTANARGKASDATGIPGLWLDIDFKSPEAHKKNDHLPPSIAEATSLVDSMPIRPGLLVASGNGLQGWWPFKEPFMFDSPEEKRKAELVLAGWNHELIRKASAQGWEADSTFDLARVFRVPGTWNQKTNPPKLVTINRDDARRFELSDFDEWTAPEQEQGIILGNKVNVDPAATMPVCAMDLCIRSKKFAKSWNKDRDDLKDTSGSGYEMSLTALAVMDGWNDQDITDMLICFGKKYNQPAKDARYYRYTIAKARKDRDGDCVSIEHIQDWSKAIEQVYGSADEDDKSKIRKGILEGVHKEIGINILRVVRFPASGPKKGMESSFKLVMPGCQIWLANSGEILNQEMFRRKLAGEKIAMQRKRRGWDKVADAIIAASEDEQADEETTAEGHGLALVNDYLWSYPYDGTEDAIADKMPFRREGMIWFYGSEFRRWCSTFRGESIDPQTMGKLLGAAGCVHSVQRHPRTKKPDRVWGILETPAVTQNAPI